MTLLQLIRSANKWRDQLNPLRSLSIARAIALREAFDRGEMSDIQWTFRSLERTDPDLLALVERRTASILEMDWAIKPVSDQHSQFDQALADDQSAALRAAYERIDNLYDAIEHLSMAIFRGFAHLQKQSLAGQGIDHLEPADQWNIARDGSAPRWKYNPDALSTGFRGLPDASLMDPSEFICLEHSRPIDFYALPKFVRSSLGEKDWTAFCELYGIPSGIITMPPNVRSDQEADFALKAQAIADGAAGALPNGSTYTPNDQPRGVNPFRGYLDYCTEKLVLVGTGGLLTMLTQSGSGTLAGGAHADTFRQLARGHARRISEAFQRQLDKLLLRELFPAKPVLAYFALDFQSEPDTDKMVDHILKLSQAGYKMSPEEVAERTGYEVELPDPPPPPAPQSDAANPTSQQMPGDDMPRLGSKSEDTPQPGSKSEDEDPTEELQSIKNRLQVLRSQLIRGPN